MSQPKGTSLSLRPFPISDTKPKSLADFISRVNAQSGGFREVSEEKLRQEQQLTQSSPQDGEDVDMSDGEDDESADGLGASRPQDLMQTRIEVLQNIDVATNAAMLTLDSLSLLLSKQNPTQASATLSKHLRDIVGIGTLGADRLEDSNITPAKEKDQEEVAQGLTIMEINNTRESAASATEFLQNEVELESKYWEEIIGVQKNGWAVCKMTNDKRMLGVRFGFPEAAPEFRNNGLAPLRRGDDGSVRLDCDQLGDVSERLVITYEKDDKLLGRSALATQATNNATIEGQVLEARNALFSQELWHELTRESRTLAAYDVRAQDNRLQIGLKDSGCITLELLSADSLPSSDEFLPENHVTESISLALQIMLSHTHRNTELMRTRPFPPHISRARTTNHTYTLLRPVLAHIAHLESTKECTRYVGAIIQALKKAGLPSSFTLLTPLPSLTSPGGTGPNQPTDAQILVHNLTQPTDCNIELQIVPGMSFTVRGRTFLFPFMGTIYHILLPAGSPLERICPPYKDGFPDSATVRDSLRTSISKILAAYFISTLPRDVWATNIKGTSILDAEKENSDLQFAIKEDESGTPYLAVSFVQIQEDGQRRNRQWIWRGQGESQTRTLSSLVEDYGRRSIDFTDA